MSDDVAIVLAALFLAAIPVNAYAAREFRREAGVLPRIAALVLLSRLISVLAFVAIALGIASFTSVLFLTTGVRVIPVPGTTVLLIVAFLVASFANVLAVVYLRRMRREEA